MIVARRAAAQQANASERRQLLVGVLSMLGVVALWSVTSVMTKLALRGISPPGLAAARLWQGVAVLTAFHLLSGKRLRDLLPLSGWHLAGGLGVAVNYLLFSLGLYYTTASAGALVIQVQFVGLVVLAAVILGERVPPLRLASIAVVVAGVVLVFSGQGQAAAGSPDPVLGNLIMLGGGLGWSVYALANKALAGGRRNLVILIPVLTIGALAVTPVALLTPGPGTGLGWQGVLILGFLGVGGTGLNFLLLSHGLKRLSAAAAGTLTALAPTINIVLAVIILSEPITGGLVAGAVLVLAGVTGTVGLGRRR